MKTIAIGCILSLAVMAACASNPGTQPHDMSAAQHAQAASEHEKMGMAHEGLVDPKADVNDCEGYLGSCWSSNPASQHREEAREHRALAAKHRAASAALRNAEATACVGISDADRDVSPFVQRQAILRVQPFVQPTNDGYTTANETVGATVVLMPAVGVTSERLQRIVNCHIARAASLGHDAPELSFCPLAVSGAGASVTSSGDGFAVNISSPTSDGAKEILARAERLVAR